MRFLYFVLISVLLGCGATKNNSPVKNYTLDDKLAVLSEPFKPFVFDKIIISSKVNFQYNQQFLTFDLTSRIDSSNKILLTGNIIFPLFKILLNKDIAFGYDRIRREFFETSIKEINNKYGLRLGLNEIENIFIGNPIVSLDEINKLEKVNTKDGILINYSANSFNYIFLFDNQFSKLKSQEIFHTKSGASMQLLYSGSFTDSSKDIPSLIKIKICHQNNLINLNIKNRSRIFNNEINFPYKVPRGFSKIEI